MEKKRIYSEEQNRIAKLNQVMIISMTFIELFLILALVVQTFTVETSFGKLGIFPLIVLIIGMVVNWVMFAKKKQSPNLKYVMLASFFVGWFFLMVAGTNVMVPFYIYPLVVATVLYNDKKFENILFYAMLVTTFIRAIAWGVSGQLLGGDSISLTSIIVHLAIIIVLHMIAKYSRIFTGDMLGTVQDEHEMQGMMLKDMMQISENVQKGVADTNQLVESLQSAASAVHDSIEDISGKTQITVENVQEQSEMTQQIKGKIVPSVEYKFGSKAVYLFSPNDVNKYRRELGIKEHDDTTIKEDFFEFLEERDYSLSYKMPFMLAMIEEINTIGDADIESVLTKYIEFYLDRLQRGLPVDRSTCPYNKETLKDRKVIRRSMLTNPFEKFERKRFMYYSKDLSIISINHALFSQMTAKDWERIKNQMNEDLVNYYKELGGI